jgi:hypothetical protein
MFRLALTAGAKKALSWWNTERRISHGIELSRILGNMYEYRNIWVANRRRDLPA